MLEVGKRIKQRREELGLTQDELATRTGYKSRSSINKIERGGNDLPQTKIVAFAQALRTTPSYLLGWEDDPIDYDDPDIVSELRTDILDHFDGDAKAAYEAQQAIYEDAAKSQAEEQDENLVILNRNAKKLTPEKRKQLLDMARLMFKEEFDD